MNKINSIAQAKELFKHYASAPDIKKHLVISIVTILSLVMGFSWIYGLFRVSTDDAYVNANIVQISPQVTGRITNLYVSNNQYVKKGDPLFDIDPETYQIAVDKAKAQLAITRQTVDQLSAAVTAAAAEVAVREAEYRAAKSTNDRTATLVKRNVLSKQSGDNAIANDQSAFATLQAAQANLAQAQSNLGKPGDENEQVRLAKANLNDAELKLAYTHVVAPSDGMIANLSSTPGTVIEANQPVFALINSGDFWVDANLKETDLKNIKPGQKADIQVDMYPGRVFKGEVVSISGGSGTAFSLLPPQNATGNWVKVTQRVPVRVRFVHVNDRYPLRIGTSATVKIHT